MNQLTLSSQHHCKVTSLVTWQPQSFCFPPSSWWKKIFWFLHSRIYSAPEFVGSWSSAYRSESHSVEWSDLVWPLLNKYIYFFFFFFPELRNWISSWLLYFLDLSLQVLIVRQKKCPSRLLKNLVTRPPPWKWLLAASSKCFTPILGKKVTNTSWTTVSWRTSSKANSADSWP